MIINDKYNSNPYYEMWKVVKLNTYMPVIIFCVHLLSRLSLFNIMLYLIYIIYISPRFQLRLADLPYKTVKPKI